MRKTNPSAASASSSLSDLASSMAPSLTRGGGGRRVTPRALSLLGVIAVLAILPSDALAQRGKRVSGGISMGVNEARFTGSGLWWERLLSEPEPGFTRGRRIGLRLSGFLDVALGPRLALRVEAAYSQVGMGYQDVQVSWSPYPWNEYDVRLTYLEFPVLAKLAVLGGGHDENGPTLSLFAGPVLAFKTREEYRTLSYGSRWGFTAPELRRYRFTDLSLDDDAQGVDPRFVVGAEGRMGIGGRAFVIDLRFAKGLRKLWKYDRSGLLDHKNRVLSLSAGTRLF